MDADELVVWRCRRVSGRSAWRKHVGRVQKTPVYRGYLSNQSGTIEAAKASRRQVESGPGHGREEGSPHE